MSLGIARDESKNRLDLRYSVTVCTSAGEIKHRKGFLGRAHMLEGGSAQHLIQATKRIAGQP